MKSIPLPQSSLSYYESVSKKVYTQCHPALSHFSLFLNVLEYMKGAKELIDNKLVNMYIG